MKSKLNKKLTVKAKLTHAQKVAFIVKNDNSYNKVFTLAKPSAARVNQIYKEVKNNVDNGFKTNPKPRSTKNSKTQIIRAKSTVKGTIEGKTYRVYLAHIENVWHKQAVFYMKKNALDYAKALADLYPKSFIKVEG